MIDDLIRALEESEYHLSTERERVAALRQEIADVRAALGEWWLDGGVSLAEGIRRKTRALESELASDHCAERPRVLYEGKGFEWALARMREGKAVRRKAWSCDWRWIDLEAGECFYLRADDRLVVWLPSTRDLLACDWFVA